MKILGIDTSNYTTSVALYDTVSGEIMQEKLLLPVKSGELGLRQSDAVFHHTKQLPIVMGKLFEGQPQVPRAVGVSV
ncbi:MAG: peptidase M22, partial [Oscillospiraceae bacterium]|nr:peptidase M22 [Oscillospiraceae bacterium]